MTTGPTPISASARERVSATIARHGRLDTAAVRQIGMIALSEGIDLEVLLTEARRQLSGNVVSELQQRRSAESSKPVIPHTVAHTPAASPAPPGTGARPPTPTPTPTSAQIPPPISPSAYLHGATPDPALTPLPEQIDPAARLIKRALLVVGGLSLLLISAAVVVSMALRPPADPIALTPVPPEQDSASAAPVETPPQASAAAPVAPSAADLLGAEPPMLLRALSAGVEAIELDPAVARSSFEQAMLAVSSSWPRFKPDEMTAAQELVIEFVYRAASVPELAAAAASIASGGTPGPAAEAASVTHAVFSAGMRARLLSERELPAGATAAVRAAAPEGLAPPASFRDGALAELTSLADRFAKQAPVTPPQWSAWIACVIALRDPNTDPSAEVSDATSRPALMALSALLASPDAVRADANYPGVIGDLVSLVSWREGDESRRWLLRWFDTPTVSSEGLSVLIAQMQRRSSAAGIDLSFALSRAAGDAERSALRDRVMQAWGLGGGDEREERRLLTEAARARFEQKESLPPLRRLASALAYARLNEAAGLLEDGQVGAAAALIRDPDGPSSAALALPAPDAPPEAPDQTDWVARYANAERAVAPRLELLAQIDGASLSPAAAEVIVSEAIRSASSPVRDAARQIVRRGAQTLSVAGALLEALPTMPRTRDSAEMIEWATRDLLPSFRDEAWRVAARRALVSAMLAKVSIDQESLAVEALAQALAASYAARGDSAGASQAPATLTQSGEALRLAWRARAMAAAPGGPQPARLAELDAAHAARAALAQGVVQRFAAEQVGAAEMMGAAVVAQTPSAAADVDAALDALARDRRAATHIFEQIEAAERAMLRLWVVRLTGSAA